MLRQSFKNEYKVFFIDFSKIKQVRFNKYFGKRGLTDIEFDIEAATACLFYFAKFFPLCLFLFIYSFYTTFRSVRSY